jgi:uncharacterized phage protein gp47/JayE
VNGSAPALRIDYSNRDYASILQSLLNLAALKLPEWTDRSENDPGLMLLELFASTADVLLYYQDRIANEAFLATAVERQSVIDLLALIGYTLATPAPATATLSITAPNDASQAGKPVQINQGAQFATVAGSGQSAISFVYLPPSNAPLIIARDGSGGAVTAQITVLNATQIVNEALGVSDGTPNQSFALTQTPVLLPSDGNSQDYLTVEVDSGGGYVRWSRADTLLYKLGNDTAFTVQVRDDDSAVIQVGDGTYGAIPPINAKLRATYLIGGGQAGNVGAGTITVVRSGVNTAITVSNPSAATGGADRETIDHARAHAPSVFRSFDRAVTAADYAALAENVPGVDSAIAVAAGWNYVDIYVAAAGGAAPTDDLRARVLRYLDTRRMVSTLVSIRTPAFVTIALTIQVGVNPVYYNQDVATRVQSAIAAAFAIDQLEFGQTFYISRLYDAVQQQDGVSFAVIQMSGTDQSGNPVSAANGTLPLAPMQFPQLGAVSITATGGL